MKNLLLGFLSVHLVTVSLAKETVAWKCPLTQYAYAGLDTEGIVEATKAPEPSPFFKPGDELWDLSAIPVESRLATNPKPEWIVWNATSRRIISKADLNAIWQLDLRLGKENLPTQCRFTAEVFSVPTDGTPLSIDAAPACSLSWVKRGGFISMCEVVTKKGTIRVRENTASGSLLEGRVLVTCSLPGHPLMEVDTVVALSDGIPLWVARDFDGSKGLDLRFTARHELMDGSPFSEAVLTLKDGKETPVREDTSLARIASVSGGGWLGIYWMSADELSSLSGIPHTPPEDVDPFAERSGEMPENNYGLKQRAAPQNLHPWFPSDVFDLTDTMEKMGLGLKNTSGFAGYDLMTRRTFLFSTSKLEVEKFEQLVTPTCRLSPTLVAVSATGHGMTRLVARSGVKATLSSGNAEDSYTRSFRMEPTIAENDEVIDLRLSIKNETVPEESFAVETSMSLGDAIPLEFLSHGGKKVTVTAETSQVHLAP